MFERIGIFLGFFVAGLFSPAGTPAAILGTVTTPPELKLGGATFTITNAIARRKGYA